MRFLTSRVDDRERSRNSGALIRRLAVVASLATLPASFAPSVQAQGFRWPEEPENLQVLSEDVKGARLGQVMRGFAISLGVRCEHCHVGEGNDLSHFDFASDEKPAKEKARVMMRMVQAINDSHLAELSELGVAPENRIRVTCMTCHRTRPRPLMLEDVLEAAIDSAGADAAVARYRELRAEHYGGFAYDFSPGTLARLAERLSARERLHEAIAILELEMETNGEQPGFLFALGTAQARVGDREAAIRTLERGLQLAPERMQPRFRERLEQLRTP